MLANTSIGIAVVAGVAAYIVGSIAIDMQTAIARHIDDVWNGRSVVLSGGGGRVRNCGS
jgi:hypothetical protein